MFDEELIFLKEDLQNKEQVFEFLYSKLHEIGLVKEEFLEKVKERESVFPTGLNIDGFGVAIPHTDSIYVNKSQIAYVSLSEPVFFKGMGNEIDEIPVTQVFMLALKESHEQLEVLQKLVDMFQNKKHMSSLISADSKIEFEQVLKEAELIN